MKPNISAFNVVTVMINNFAVSFMFAFIIMFGSFILENPSHYNIPKEKVGGILGIIGSVT